LSSSADTPARPRPKVAGHRSRSRATAPASSGTATTRLGRADRVAPAGEPTDRAGAAAGERSTGSWTRVLTRPTRRTSSVDQPGPTGGSTAADHVVEQEATSRRRWIGPLVALVASLAVLGTLAGIGLQDSGGDARAERAATNQARTSIEQMLSYNYKTIDAQSAQVAGLLTGSFRTEFSTAMDKEIKPLAVKNQTVVQARVSDVGVMSSSATTVKVMAFVNQARVGTDQKEPVVDQNRVLATLSKVGDRWLISRVDAF
jgi:Mce-associated membrane protein